MAVGCSGPANPTATPARLESVPPVSVSCRDGGELKADTGVVVDVVLAGVDHARVQDLRCGPPADRRRICRALLVIGTVDPATLLQEPDRLARAVDAVVWVSDDASSVAPAPTAEALRTIRDITIAIGSSPSDAQLVGLLTDRAADPVVTALDAHWAREC